MKPIGPAEPGSGETTSAMSSRGMPAPSGIAGAAGAGPSPRNAAGTTDAVAGIGNGMPGAAEKPASPGPGGFSPPSSSAVASGKGITPPASAEAGSLAPRPRASPPAMAFIAVPRMARKASTLVFAPSRPQPEEEGGPAGIRGAAGSGIRGSSQPGMGGRLQTPRQRKTGQRAHEAARITRLEWPDRQKPALAARFRPPEGWHAGCTATCRGHEAGKYRSRSSVPCRSTGHLPPPSAG